VFVTEEVVRTSGIKTEDQIYTLTLDKKNTQISYLDGMGRSYQTLAVASSAKLAKDIVQLVEFDAQGRSSKSYLPYVASTATGALQVTPASSQAAFYVATGDKIADDASPFAKTTFEDSPLGRAVEQGSVGAAFQPGTAHTQQVSIQLT